MYASKNAGADMFSAQTTTAASRSARPVTARKINKEARNP
jgi:hypothetical protein